MNRKNLAGVFVAIAIALVAFYSKPYTGFSPALASLLVGILLANLFSVQPITAGAKWVEKEVLSVAIILIGAGFNLKALFKLNPLTIIWILGMVAAVYFFAKFVGKQLKLSDKLSTLLGAGSAICGSAAIMASAAVVKSESSETGLAVSVVNLLGSIGIFILPGLSLGLYLDYTESALLTGGTLQSMGHVVAAGFSLNTETGELATLIKMARISLLIPFLIWLSVTFKVSDETKPKFSLPYFIPGFVIMVVLSILFGNYGSYFKQIASIGELLIIPAMAAIGLNIKIKPLLSLAPKVIFAGIIVFAFQILAYIGFILIVR